MNPYEILGVRIGATIDEIKSAYKNLAKKYHPDISKEPNAVEMMKQINNAYDVLTKPQPVRQPVQNPSRVVIVVSYGYSTGWSTGGSAGGSTTGF